jgi:hypothetical protein
MLFSWATRTEEDALLSQQKRLMARDQPLRIGKCYAGASDLGVQ